MSDEMNKSKEGRFKANLKGIGSSFSGSSGKRGVEELSEAVKDLRPHLKAGYNRLKKSCIYAFNALFNKEEGGFNGATKRASKQFKEGWTELTHSASELRKKVEPDAKEAFKEAKAAGEELVKEPVQAVEKKAKEWEPKVKQAYEETKQGMEEAGKEAQAYAKKRWEKVTSGKGKDSSDKKE